tara:strand:- start:1245 stop:2420 length:1176 start_codon:yes stop_codon:yes gene_type:complete
MKPEIFIYNPHYNSMIGKTVGDFLRKSKIPLKHGFLLNLIKENKISILISGNYSSLGEYFTNKLVLKLAYLVDRLIYKYLQIYLWILINGINPLKVNILFDIKKLKKDDILIIYSNINLDVSHDISENVKVIVGSDCKKLIHLSHYNYLTKTISENCKKIKNFHFIAENNLKKNSLYFQKYFSYYKNVFFSFPFVVKTRFQNLKQFTYRESRCISVGSFQVYDKIDNMMAPLLNFYKQNTVHPIRKEIFDNQDIFKDYIECLNAPVIKNQDYKLRKYYDFDIVEKFNSFQMFICGEELGDLPGISFAEGMRTGCVYMGNGKNYCYKDLGMIDGVHYIAHNNDINDIVDKIKFYKKNINKLENISKNGYELACQKFDENYVKHIFESNYKLI